MTCSCSIPGAACVSCVPQKQPDQARLVSSGCSLSTLPFSAGSRRTAIGDGRIARKIGSAKERAAKLSK